MIYKVNATEIEQLVNEMGKSIYGFCYKIVRNTFEAEELYQQTFLRALELSDKIDKYDNPKAFLISLSISIWKNQIRKSARHERIAPTVQITEDNKEMLKDNFSIEKHIIEWERKEIINEVINSLEDKSRIPLILYYNAGFSVKEIAKICKCPQGTVKSRLSKAREKVRKGLVTKGYE